MARQAGYARGMERIDRKRGPATSSTARDVANEVLRRYPDTFADEVGIRLDGPSGLFRLLVLSLLMSARIRSTAALEAAQALYDQHWTTAKDMADATWEARTKVLNRSGYACFDERTSTMLGETCDVLLERYHGDLRELRDEAGEDPGAERRLLKECKGMGDVGVDIFFREVQRTWSEIYPFADSRAMTAAQRLQLGDDTSALERLASGDDFVRLVNGLVRVDLDGSYDELAA